EQQKALARLRLKTLQDLLFYAPVRYSNVSTITTIDNAESGQEVTLYGVIKKPTVAKGFRSKIPMAKATFTDIENTNIAIVWMNQPYLAKMFADGDQVKLTGKITTQKNGSKILM